MGKLFHPERLEGVDIGLQAIIENAVSGLSFDCLVAEGVRSAAKAIENYRHGRTVTELAKVGIKDPPLPGPQITWTLRSKHVTGKAVDLYPLVNGKLDDASGGYARFDALYHAVMMAAAVAKKRVRYGGDWDQDGKLREKGERDSPHFELA